MTDKRTQAEAGASNTQKDPDDWVTGDEPMTGAQRSYLKTLSEEAKQPFDDSLTKAEASRRIEELQALTGRGRSGGGHAGGAGGGAGAGGGDGDGGGRDGGNRGSARAGDTPPDAGPLESLGKAISDTVTDSEATPNDQVGNTRAGR